MNQQLALLMALMGGMGSGASQGFDSGMNSSLPNNNDILQALRGFSPVNTNPVYGSTVSRFFDRSPLAGAQAFTGANPLQAGASGNNAVRSNSGHSSFMPTDFNNNMQRWIGP